MKVYCRNCNQKYNIDESILGKEIQCQQCNQLTLLSLPTTQSVEATQISKVHCPDCNQKYSINDSQFDTEIVCKVCLCIMIFPAPEGVRRNLLVTQRPSFKPDIQTRKPPSVPSKNKLLLPSLLFLILIALGYVGYQEINHREVSSVKLLADNDGEASTVPERIEAEVKIAQQQLMGDESVEGNAVPVEQTKTEAILKPEVIVNTETLRNENGNLMISHFEAVVKPFAQEHCISCHGPKKEKGNFRIDKLMNTGLIRSEADAEHWQEVLDVLNVGDMPPIEEVQPRKEEMTAMLDALYQTTANARDIIASKGTGVMRRMNSREYTNTIKDLLGLTVPVNTLPQDRGAFGFDTFGVDLNTTPAELQAYIDVGYSLMSKLTEDYSSGREVPDEVQNIFGDISKAPKDSEAEGLFKRFVYKVYRHQPISAKVIKDMTSIFKFNRRKGNSFWNAASVALTCALASPNLIFIVEHDVELTQLDIANRLSLLLWSSVPDETLIKLAEEGELTKPEVYSKQFNRMIQDPKADRFFNSFIGQWLELERLDVVNFDEGLFPQLKKKEAVLKKAMEKETLAFIRHLIKKNRPAKDIVTADFTMLNAQLAKHYGIENFRGKKNKFSKITLNGKDKVRGGLLGQGSVQMLTSNGARTSPVERGVYILRKLLDSSPPPAPADVPEVEDITGEHQTTRDLLKHHMTTPQCATCHVKIDSLGFGMESFGPLGRWRTHEGNLPIDASGQMTNGKKFKDYEGLVASLAVNDERIAKGFLKAVMSYGIGRQVRYTDNGEITKILELNKENGFKLKDLIFQVLQSDAFLTKK